MASNDDNLKTDSLRLGDNDEHSAPTTTAVHSPESNGQSASAPASAPEPAANPLTSGHHESIPHQHIVTETSNTQPVAGGESAPPPQQPSDANTLPTSNAPAVESGASTIEAPPAEQASQESDAKEEDQGPSLMITLLLTSGSRHPFKIDGKYLRKRSVNVENNDPFAMSVYTLKELIWREWRQDWEPRPSSPSYIRLISFGKLLDDKAPLSDSKFNHDAPNVVHMTIKPQELVDEEDAKGSKPQYSREREASERSPGCRCIIQ
ncbi:ubiquitin-related domain-containing protein [Aspergillus pseudonomiae]|uniref:Ubiquitin-related domain-containing protein n=1 Tax=Aspergillus pseudonomiae TaxID=1506151 RepID=A0A5N6HWL5_9EURO|nr:ubiquitin-related domain-containing protein [Aspergillus pseudonomiae]KAB8258786.1 ubiquitin-related domain-containing protein [Aspergillus pseudonomiae]KAE8403382.1 ubiquitin-related domain-containing protein [Aspergillus pseudonomiae]